MKTTFKDISMRVTISGDRTFTDELKENNIPYTSRTLPIFQTLLPLDVLSYGGYEIIYTDSEETKHYVYTFVTEKKTSLKCVTFYPKHQLDNLFLLDLEQALRTDRLTFERDEDADKRLIPTYLEEEEAYAVITENGLITGSFEEILREFTMNNFLYHYKNKYYTEYPDHQHDFNDVLKALIDEPDSFSIEGYEDDYSIQERAYLRNLQDQILLIKKENRFLTQKELLPRGPLYLKKELERR